MATSSRGVLESRGRITEVVDSIFRVGSLKVGTLTGKFLELVDGLKKRHVDAICVKRLSGMEVIRFNDRVIMIKLVVDVVVVNIVSAYAPHVGLGDEEKKLFWDCLDDLVSTIPND
ncbi:uncharacterized protein LOC141718890 [Apium graveolens]|uniref:uncharacterized protein LOC141718890 n=1 Tax=Apium graveolens TaxID=4045 RepID=UPI003D7BA2C0